MPRTSTRVVFLCYSRRDRTIVRKCQAIIRAAGLIPWRDEDSIQPGTKWRLSVANAIAKCDRVLVFWCCHASESDEVRREYWHGINAGKPIAPIRLDRTELPDALSTYQATDMPGWSSFNHRLMTIERPLWIVGIALMALGVLVSAAR